MERLNEKQKESTRDLLKYYKNIYVCKCGSVYGSDAKENYKICPNCEQELLKKKKI